MYLVLSLDEKEKPRKHSNSFNNEHTINRLKPVIIFSNGGTKHKVSILH
jgi:hypothetical protein